MTLEAWMDQWVALRSAALKPRTVESYRDLLRLHIVPAIGGRRLKRLKAEHIEPMLAALSAQGKTRTAELCYVLLRAALSEAVQLRRLRFSPMDGVARPRHRQTRPSAWSPEDMQRYLLAIRSDKHRLAWLLALLCGLRRGEICGLRWCDVDLRGRVLHICNQRQRLADGRLIDAPPKSDSGFRDVPIPVELVPLLRSCFRLGSVYVDPITPSALDSAHRRTVRRAGVPKIPLHGLRHTMATNAIRNGATMRALQLVLGHADYRTTANMYTHPDLEMLRNVVDAASRGVVQ